MTEATPARRMLAVAHRWGNSVVGMQSALAAGVDLVEADVRGVAGRLEVRHHLHFAGSPAVWDGHLLPHRRPPRFELSALLAALGADHRLMLDLKGDDPRLGAQVAAVVTEILPGRPITVCCRDPRLLAAFGPEVRQVLSAGTRRELARLPGEIASAAGPVHGVSVAIALLTTEVVASLHELTPLVMAWPIDASAALARARAVGADAVISKDLDLLRGVVGQG